MGYLDNTSVTVDAILTKQGRKLIAQGNSLNIRHFTLSDTGVDYTLWNPDHPSGSAYYGESIDNLPQVEANTNVLYSLDNKLVTLAQDSMALPTLDLDKSSISFSTSAVQSLNVQLLGFSKQGNQKGITVLIHDTNVATLQGASRQDITGNIQQFVKEQDIPNSAAFEIGGAGPYNIKIVPSLKLASDSTTNITILDNTTGAQNTMTISVDANIIPKTNLTTKPKG
mgnify:CR=1 FL=1